MKIYRSDLLIFSLALLLNGCALRPAADSGFKSGHEMENYAQERYMVALEYMEQGRFELANQQFAVAYESAVSAELKGLARTGQAKSGRIIAERR